MKKLTLLLLVAITVSSCTRHDSDVSSTRVAAPILPIILGVVDRATNEAPTDATFNGHIAELRFTWAFTEADSVQIAAWPEVSPWHQITLYDPTEQSPALHNIGSRSYSFYVDADLIICIANIYPGNYYFQLQMYKDQNIISIMQFGPIYIPEEPLDRCAG